MSPLELFDRLEPAWLGDAGPDVRFARRRLKAWPDDAPYDLELAAKVRGFQLSVGLPVTGGLDSETYRLLAV